MLDWIGDVVEAITEELADYKEHRKARAAKQEKAKLPVSSSTSQYHAERSLAELKGGRSQRQINGVDPFVGLSTSTGAIYYYEAPANCLRVITIAPFTDTVVPYKQLAILDGRREQKLSERKGEADGDT